MLHHELDKLSTYPFHMPGHKRNEKFGIPGAAVDITEIEGFDNLHHPTGLIRELEERFAQHYGAAHSFLSVGGSTLGLLCAIFALCEEGDTVIVARNCHKSVFNACYLKRLNIVFLEPEFDCALGCYTAVKQARLEQLEKAYPQAKAVVITSPTYEGFISEIHSTLPLIIDAAHGAHFGMARFPAYPTDAAIVISSLHKTLPALTQTALINVYDKRLIERVRLMLDLLETSSPSYVLLYSASVCCDYLQNHRADFERFYKDIAALRHIALQHLRLVQTDDISKLVISTQGTALSGTALAAALREDFGIESELAGSWHVLLMSTVGDDAAALARLQKALLETDRTLSAAPEEPFVPPPAAPGTRQISYTAQGCPTAFWEAEGKISNEFVYAYPPDIPILLPGMPIRKSDLTYLHQLAAAGVTLVAQGENFPNTILTKAL